MCDQDHYDDDLKDYKSRAALSRRELGAIALGAGFSFLLPRAANAVAVTESEVKIKTPDGTCDAYFVHPASRPAPAVLVWPDILGLRPAFRQMGKRLAESGYAVLVINPFYRSKPAPVVAEGAKLPDPERASPDARWPGASTRRRIRPMRRRSSPGSTRRPSVDKKKKIGTTGYCMGGPMVFRTAAAVPERVGAAGTFHGGGLVTKRETARIC